MPVFSEVGMDLDTTGELVTRFSGASLGILAPAFLHGEDDGRDTHRVGEGCIVVHLEFVNRVAVLGVLVDDILDSCRFSADGGRGHHHVDLVVLEGLAPLGDKHAAHLLCNTDLLIILLVF